MRKILWIACSLLLALSMMLSGCGGASPQQAPTSAPPSGAGTAAAPSEAGTSAPSTGGGTPVTIKVFAQQGSQYNLATNSFTKEMEQKFNIKFNWQTTTWDAASAAEARQIALASGDYPDLYLLIPWVDQFSQAELLKYSKQGVIIPLNDLIQQYAPNIQAAFQKYPDYKAVSTAPDGKIYGITQLIQCYHCEHPAMMWINTTWLSKLSLKSPTTPDEFKAMLEAFKSKDPNGNGKADEIPLSGTSQFVTQSPYPYLLNAFIYYNGNDTNKVPLFLNNGQVDTAANKPELKQGLAYIAGLYKEGLIDPSAFSQNTDALKKLGDNPGVEILGAVPAYPGGWVTDPQRSKDYNPIAPLTGPNGASYSQYGPSTAPGATFVLTNKASKEAQIAAIKMLDYLFSPDGQLRGYFGVEGVDWRRPQAGETAVNPNVKPLFFPIPAKPGAPAPNDAWGPLAQYYNPRDFRDAWVAGQDIYQPANAARRLQQAADLYAPKVPMDKFFPERALWPDPTTANEQAQLQTNLGNYITQNLLQFITGSKNLDTDWNSYVQGLDQLGLKRYLQLQQAAYDVYKKTTGK